MHEYHIPPEKSKCVTCGENCGDGPFRNLSPFQTYGRIFNIAMDSFKNSLIRDQLYFCSEICIRTFVADFPSGDYVIVVDDARSKLRDFWTDYYAVKAEALSNKENKSKDIPDNIFPDDDLDFLKIKGAPLKKTRLPNFERSFRPLTLEPVNIESLADIEFRGFSSSARDDHPEYEDDDHPAEYEDDDHPEYEDDDGEYSDDDDE